MKEDRVNLKLVLVPSRKNKEHRCNSCVFMKKRMGPMLFVENKASSREEKVIGMNFVEFRVDRLLIL